MTNHPSTLGALRASGWQSRPVKAELRRNAIERIRAGEPLFPTVLGYEHTVLPQLEKFEGKGRVTPAQLAAAPPAAAARPAPPPQPAGVRP